MKFIDAFFGATAAVLSFSLSSAQSIAEINGKTFLSPYRNQNVANVTGLVTAIGPDGLWIRSTKPDKDVRTSESIYVFGARPNVTVATGDIITLDGAVTEYRSSASYIYLTEITRPANIRVVSQGNEVKPVVLGKKDTSPPTEQFSGLDNGNVFSLPNNASQLSVANPILNPSKYGLDFWESLMGELVTVKKPSAISLPNNFRDTWVIGDWKVTSKNKRGGLTLVPGDGNPEAILIGTPLDGTQNPENTKLGDDLEEITGIVFQAFGFYRILPLTAIQTKKSQKPALPDKVDWKSKGDCKRLTVGSYNVENMNPDSENIPAVAEHIVKYLNSPDIMFLQEIQDNNGPVNDDVVSANVTLETLIDAIVTIGGPFYEYASVDPVDDTNGGAPGANIRPAYLYNPRYLALKSPNQGDGATATEVLAGPKLSLNPGVIDPLNAAWTDSRRPIVAHWEMLESKADFFTVNVHFASKGGSSSIEGDARPPVNGGVDQRISQATVAGEFIAQILSKDKKAAVIAAGDFNEFAFVEPLETFVSVSGLVDIDDAANVKKTERYSYLFDMNSQALDHMYLSPKIAKGKVDVEHVHVNTWVARPDQASDHDPSVARLDVC